MLQLEKQEEEEVQARAMGEELAKRQGADEPIAMTPQSVKEDGKKPDGAPIDLCLCIG